MAEIQLTRIRSLYGDIRGLLSQIPQASVDPHVAGFLVSQFNSTVEELSAVTNTDYSRYKVTLDARVLMHSKGEYYYSKLVRPQIGRIISRLEEEYRFGETIMSEDIVTKNNSGNPHKDYWNFIWQKIVKFSRIHKKGLAVISMLIFLVPAVYLGYVIYTPEISLPIGKFGLSTKDTSPDLERNINEKSKILDRSIFNLARETIDSSRTSQQRVNLISDISDLKTKKEVGNIEDIGTGGLTVLIKGTSSEGSIGIIKCDFSSSWKQRLSLLKKGDHVNFTGSVSRYDLSQQWIVLKDCELFAN